MTRLFVWLLFNLLFRFVWAILRAIGQETLAAVREAAPRALSSAQRSLEVIAPGSRLHCGQCGGRVSADLPFCPSCGLAVNLERDGIHTGPLLLHTCRTCGAGIDLTDRFCTSCGASIVPVAQAGQRPAAVEVAAALHTIAGAGAAVMTLPFAAVLVLGLAGNASAAAFVQGWWLPALVAIVSWGSAWTALSFAAAWGLRAAKVWALHATYAVSLLWSLTAVGAIVAIPLMIALMLPGSRSWFGRVRSGNGTSLGGPGAFEGRIVIMGRR
jgi:hypothetical protein